MLFGSTADVPYVLITVCHFHVVYTHHFMARFVWLAARQALVCVEAQVVSQLVPEPGTAARSEVTEAVVVGCSPDCSSNRELSLLL